MRKHFHIPFFVMLLFYSQSRGRKVDNLNRLISRATKELLIVYYSVAFDEK